VPLIRAANPLKLEGLLEQGTCKQSLLLAAPVAASSSLTRADAGELVADATARDAREAQMSLNLLPPASNKNLETAGIKRTRVRSELDDDVLARHVAADNLTAMCGYVPF
jgi:hypothetical protein